MGIFEQAVFFSIFMNHTHSHTQHTHIASPDHIPLVAAQMNEFRQVETNFGNKTTGNVLKAIQWKMYTVRKPFNLSIDHCGSEDVMVKLNSKNLKENNC